jgi:hypothetical protein
LSSSLSPVAGDDKVLQFYVKMAEEVGFVNMPITLVVHGLIITGRLISSSKYFEKMSELFELSDMTVDHAKDSHYESTGTSREEVTEISDFSFAEIKTQHKIFMNKRDKEEDAEKYLADKSKLQYIHLKQVIAFPGGFTQPHPMNIWRGKISSVDGFAIGNIQPSVTTEPS